MARPLAVACRQTICFNASLPKGISAAMGTKKVRFLAARAGI